MNMVVLKTWCSRNVRRVSEAESPQSKLRSAQYLLRNSIVTN